MSLALQSAQHRQWGTIFFQVLHYLAHSREQYQKLNSSHTESCLQCKAQGVFIVQMPVMKSTQVPELFPQKLMLKHLFITTRSFRKPHNYQALMTSLWRIWIYNMYKPKIIVWLEAWLNHNSVNENQSFR